MHPVQSDPGILHGTPVFPGTRVPVAILFEYLRDGGTVDYFLSQFPTVTREQVTAVLELARERVSFQPASGSQQRAVG